MDFVDFEIRAWQADEGHAQVMVQSSPVGDMRRPVTVLCDEGLLGRRIESLSGRIVRLSKRGFTSGKEAAEFGRCLGETFLPLPVHTLLVRSLERIPPEDGLRLRLCLDETLADLPWEFLYRPDVPEQDSFAGFLVRDSRISLVREAPTTGQRLRPSDQKQKMVFVGCLTQDEKDCAGTKEEYVKLADTLTSVEEYLSLEFSPASADNIERSLAERPAIFHYSGVTTSAYPDKGGGQLLKRYTEGKPSPPDFLSSERLADLLRTAHIKLAVFNATDSAQWRFVEPLIRIGIPVLIGAQNFVSVREHIAFAEKFYSSIAIGLSVDEAVSWARLHLMEAGASADLGIGEISWGAFVVYMPTREAVLFPRPESRAVRERQDVAREGRQKTVDNVSRIVGEVPSHRTAASKVRILFLAANPLDTDPLRLDEEMRTIEERIRAADFGRCFEINQHWAVRLTDLSDFLLRHRPDVVHFSGHGNPNGQVVLEDVTGEAESASVGAIADLFGILGGEVRCVVLNACFSQAQAERIAEHVDCVIGTSRSISDEAATRFAGGFYRGISYGRSVKTAFDLGCNEIGLASLGEDKSPKLLSRKGVDPTDVYLIREEANDV
jgi:hypothetical protein